MTDRDWEFAQRELEGRCGYCGNLTVLSNNPNDLIHSFKCPRHPLYTVRKAIQEAYDESNKT